MNKKTLWKVRQEIVLCSLFYNDYKNSFNFNTHDVCDFFDSYADYLQELMINDGIKDDDFFKQLHNYDNDNNLNDFYNYNCSEYFINILKR